MQFEKDYLYHIYNQGNNRQKIFFNRQNYLFFLRKIKTYILPYADILSWCLMPNHFHLIVYIRGVALDGKTLGVSLRHAGHKRSFNASIGIMLMAYTKALNKQQKRTGKLFREATKAECVNCFKGNTPSFVKSEINIKPFERQYPQICFEYIHQNPVKAGLVKQPIDWEFSSARDYYAGRPGRLIAKEITRKHITFE